MRIACIHQGYELYGSDRAFIDSVAAMRAAHPVAEIEVVLPRGGPIVEPLARFASRVTFEPLWILRRRDLAKLATLGMVRLPLALMRAARRMARSDIVYVNTTVIVDYLLAARLFRGRAIVHVHEIPEGSALPILKSLLSFSGAELIFNSRASQGAFALGASSRHHVVYNGVSGPRQIAETGYDGARPLRLLMLGRINRIKGQEVLLAALASLPPETRARFAVKIVGSSFEDPGREEMVAKLIGDLCLSDQVSMSPFADDPAPLYEWADVVTVPSRRPESLGRVAIEAMAFGKPALVSAIGGLREVVADGETGWLIEPDNVAALADTMKRIVEEPSAWARFGAMGRGRYERLFSERAAGAAIQEIVAGMLDARQTNPRRTAVTPAE